MLTPDPLRPPPTPCAAAPVLTKEERKAAKKAAKTAAKTATVAGTAPASDGKVAAPAAAAAGPTYATFASTPFNQTVKTCLSAAGYTTPTEIQAQCW